MKIGDVQSKRNIKFVLQPKGATVAPPMLMQAVEFQGSTWNFAGVAEDGSWKLVQYQQGKKFKALQWPDEKIGKLEDVPAVALTRAPVP